MELNVARIYISNLLNRIETHSDGSKHLPGLLTADEIEALKLACALLEGKPCTEHAKADVIEAVNDSLSWVVPAPTTVKLDTSVFDLTPASENARICLDFGTAMSKATIVIGEEEGSDEEIRVLKLGLPGNQEEVSETMLISSVYIDNDGFLWFGKAADDRSILEEGDGKRQRLDNIKRRLSEDGLNDELGPRLNPIQLQLRATYREMILAYLMYFTWVVNRCLDDIGYPRNLTRRFAMPCFPSNKARDVAHDLKDLIGQAQILADTFSTSISDGLPLKQFLDAARELDKNPRQYSFVAEGLTEPLGVANSLLSWKTPVDMLALVVDVGAGTSDLSLYRIAVNSAENTNMAIEPEGAARGITEAGNYLDRVLVEFILSKARITNEHPRVISIRGRLELEIRNFKETLFNEGYLFVSIPGMDDVEIELDEFLALNSVVNFGKTLRQAIQSILEDVDESFIDWAASPSHYLTVVLTGGGASLPMVTELAKGEYHVHGRRVRVAPALRFPNWLRENYPELEDDYPRVAVSLGGARRTVIRSGGVARITAGGIETPRLGGYFTKGH